MGTETACGSYFSDQSGGGGGGSEMTNYYQMNGADDPQSVANQSEEEMAQSVGSSDQAEQEVNLCQQQEQQRHLHSEPPRNPWSISQQIQNQPHPSRLERSNSLTANWTFPSYQRLYSENQYGIAMAAAVQQQQQQQQQHLPVSHQNSTHHSSQLQHHGNPPSHHHHHQQQQHQHMPAMAGGNQGPPQFSKRFYYPPGKSSNNKDICGDDKHKEDGDPWNVEAQAAFLGPNLWDKTLPYDSDLKVHQYADLDEFLSENGIPVDGLPSSHLGHSTSLNGRSDSLGHCAGLSLGLSQVTTKRERSPSPSDCMSPDTINPPSPADSTFSMSSTTRDFDPRTRAFSDEELKPQPMIKKSRKQFVPDDMKDDKYWARRRKNNMAAKRSRDARRMKENQIALRAGYLEKENMNLHREVEQLKQENMELRARLSKYQEV
ncbi:hepatic leukemia factor isoform X2 [Topomyia yanbarensis]|uniref:hepatic leukemia factor isoform X2 n=1 Tax=Topomyia yanbarensis TaxID=2498891 RepID=UPI00273B6712|nr:hepatic leukemia factor isoform X2 [Topomyia yanbarensis]